jgi:hypothetical protein
MRVPEPLIADRFRQRCVPDTAVEDGLELRVTARDGVADDDEIGASGDVFSAISLEHADSFSRKKVAHRRVHVLIGPADLVPAMFQERRQSRHCRPAHANKMNSLCH